MQYFQSVDEIVDFPHETFHENHLGQAHAEVFQFGRKRLELAEVVQLHGGGKIQ